MPVRGRDTASRAPSMMVASHVDLISRPKPRAEATVFMGTGKDVDKTFVVDKSGAKAWLGAGCGHMAIGRGKEPTRLCHIPDCRVNQRALAHGSATDGPQTAEQAEG